MPRNTTPFRVKTDNRTTKTEAERKELFDENIAGLFKVEQPVTVLNNKLRYYKPGMVQTGYVMNSLFEVVSDLIFTEEELQKLKDEARELYQVKMWEKCAEYLTSIAENEASLSMLWVQLTFNRESVRCMYQAIRECFPDITEPHRLTDAALVELYTQLINDTLFAQDAK